MRRIAHQAAAQRTEADTSIYQIPLVFHIIHKGEAEGVETNVSNDAIAQQIRVLNEDYRRKPNTNGYNNDPRGEDARIEFVLAQRRPDSSLFSGIDRFNGGNRTYMLGDNDQIKSFSIFPADKYLNVWVVDLEGTFLGYSTFPTLSGFPLNSSGGPEPEGVVIDYKTLPTVASSGRYILGRSATHEIGHYLGLMHIWGDVGNCQGDDYCNDTPLQQDQISGCPASPPVCVGEPAPMVANYLNYSDDRCMNIFTHDQVGRMRIIMNHAVNRPSLKMSVGLLEVPKAKDIKLLAYPNPSTNQVSITYSDPSDSIVELQLYTIDGRKLLAHDFRGTSRILSLNLTPLQSGTYFLSYKTHKGIAGVIRLVRGIEPPRQ